MTDAIDDWTQQIHVGDARETLAEMPESSVHMVMTSPPYYGLRDYGEGVESIWGGDDDCDHDWTTETKPAQGGHNTDENPPDVGGNASTQDTRLRGEGVESDRCVRCGAWRGQLGLEPTLDQYVANMVEVGRAIRRILRPDGVWRLNLGDSYAGSGRGQWDNDEGRPKEAYRPDAGNLSSREDRLGRKQKMFVPHRTAIALQGDGWVARNDVLWQKPNPMPNPVKDRFNTTFEFVFLLAPNPHYWFDLDAVREPAQAASLERGEYGSNGVKQRDASPHPGRESESSLHNFPNTAHPRGKNPGDVIQLPTQPYPDAHFAVFPEGLCERPIESGCPPEVCAECGAPYVRPIEEQAPWEIENPARTQLARAIELAEEHGLTEEHLEAIRAYGFSDAEAGQEQTGYGRNAESVVRLAQEAKQALGGYFREFTTVYERPGEPEPTCDCDTDATEPGIVLDPFAGAGTTCHVAKRLGRRFIGIDLNREYVAMAQRRVGIDVDEPELLLDDDQPPLRAFAADGGDGS